MATENMDSTPKAVKPGYRTTEFWLTLVSTLTGLALASGVVPETGVWAKVVALVVSALTAVGYAGNRTKLKNP